MRRIAQAVAVAAFVLGFTWQYGGWILEWVGRALGVRGLTTTYSEFVDSYVARLMTEGSFMRLLMPWILMAFGLVVLAMLHRKDNTAARGE